MMCNQWIENMVWELENREVEDNPFCTEEYSEAREIIETKYINPTTGEDFDKRDEADEAMNAFESACRINAFRVGFKTAVEIFLQLY